MTTKLIEKAIQKKDIKKLDREGIIGHLGLLEAKRRSLYRTRPDLWLVERFNEPLTSLIWDLWDKEAYSNHKWDGTKNPFLEAFKALVNKEWVGMEACTSAGKTYIMARIAFWFLDVYDNAMVVTTAPKKSQLINLLWKEINKCFQKFKRIRPQAQIYKSPAVRVMQDDEFVEWSMIGEVAGVDAGAEVAQKMAGFHAKNMLFLLDEMSAIPQSIYLAIENTCTDTNNLICASGNPLSNTDTLHKFCVKQKVRHITISAYDHPNVVLENAGKEAPIGGAVTQGSIDMRKREYGEESNLFLARVRGISPAQSTDSLIKGKWLDDAVLKVAERFDNTTSYNAMGVDVANSTNGDAAAIAIGEGNTLRILKEFQCPDANQLGLNLIYDNVTLEELYNQRGVAKENQHIYQLPTFQEHNILPSCIGIDTVGVGVGTINAFINEGYTPIALQGGYLKRVVPLDEQEKALYEFGSLRDQMYWAVREDLLAGVIGIDLKIIGSVVFNQLKNELTAHRFVATSSKIKIEAKEAVKKRLGKSPNYADAFVYWNWMRRGYYVEISAPAHGFYMGE